MRRARITTLALATIVLAGNWGQLASHPDAGPLQGSWEITSVQRDGRADAAEVGGHVTFAGDVLAFEPGRWSISLDEAALKPLDEEALRRQMLS